MNRVLLTGSTGFLGRALRQELLTLRVPSFFAVRNVQSDTTSSDIVIGDITDRTNWRTCLDISKCSVVIHSAARVHIMNDASNDPLEMFRDVNTFGTLNLARQAAATGVKRFIFISSIKVSGWANDWGHQYEMAEDGNYVLLVNIELDAWANQIKGQIGRNSRAHLLS